ncbi:hypothetical protein [Streptomyces sp. MK7]|uniref:hypothetical protein n=1 Tax=Streptomyces sp. MK7 TaxID=3067635 RepID=UPI00292F5252|nr:hypothetical protein [Streptomyces sp. MK7]
MPDEITLRPVTADDLDLFERGFDGPEGTGPYQWFGFASSAGLRRQSAENGLLGADGGVLSVAEAGSDGGPGRVVRRHLGAAATSTCWTPTIGLVPAARGRGTGTWAERLPAEYLFDHTRAERLRAWTDCVRQPGRAACVGEGGLRQEGRAALGAVARRPVARSGDLLHARVRLGSGRCPASGLRPAGDAHRHGGPDCRRGCEHAAACHSFAARERRGGHGPSLGSGQQ